MILGEIFTMLYPFVPIIGIGAYAPQIVSLLKNKTCIESFSISMWATWAVASLLGFGYSWFSLFDLLTSFTCLMHLLVQLYVIFHVVHKRKIIHLTLKSSS